MKQTSDNIIQVRFHLWNEQVFMWFFVCILIVKHNTKTEKTAHWTEYTAFECVCVPASQTKPYTIYSQNVNSKLWAKKLIGSLCILNATQMFFFLLWLLLLLNAIRRDTTVQRKPIKWIKMLAHKKHTFECSLPVWWMTSLMLERTCLNSIKLFVFCAMLMLVCVVHRGNHNNRIHLRPSHLILMDC